MRSIFNQATSLVRLTIADRAVSITAAVLGTAVLLVVTLYWATYGAQDGEFLARIHWEIGLSRDRSMSEIFSYGLAFLASVLFFLSFIETRSPMLLFLSAFMGFVWFDDASSYHERFGRWLVGHLELNALPGLRPLDTGEILAWAVAGFILLVPFAYGLFHRRVGDLGILAMVAIGLFSLALCGLVADLLHIAAPETLNLFFEVFEDGGEMVAIAYLSTLALSLARNAVDYYDTAQSDAKMVSRKV